MDEKARIEMSFLKDRGIKKLRVNFVSKNQKIFGFIKPVELLKNRERD